MTENNQRKENHLYVAETLNRELCTILAIKINKKDGMADIIRDVMDLRTRKGFSTKEALRLILKTAQEISEINKLGKEEYKLE